jgi:hypothetical protein
MEPAGRQRALLAVVGALSLSGLACTERVPLISTVTELDAAPEPEDAYVPPDRAMHADLLEPDLAPRDSARDVRCWDFTQGHRLDLQYPEVVIALDRSYSMLVEPKAATKTWWTVARQELLNYMRENDGAIAFGYAEFPGRVSCDPNFGCCTRMPVSPSLDSHDGIEHEWQCGSPASCQTSDDSPSGHVLSRIRAQYDSDTDPMPYRYVLLVTDGPPSCQDEPDECGLAGRQAARLFSNLTIETMVLPLGTAARDDACLNSVAVMGHTRDPGATSFPWVSDPGQMSAQLRKMMSRVEERICRFYVNGEIKNRDSLAVTVDFKPLPRDPAHKEGWDYDPAADREIQVYGSACKKLRCQQLDGRDFRSEESCTQCGQNVTCH